MHNKWSLRPFINWTELTWPSNQFIHEEDDKIRMRVTVKVDELRKYDDPTDVDIVTTMMMNPDITQCDEMRLTLTVNRVSEVLAILSPAFIIFAHPLRIQIYKSGQFDSDDKQNEVQYLEMALQ